MSSTDPGRFEIAVRKLHDLAYDRLDAGGRPNSTQAAGQLAEADDMALVNRDG